MEDEEPVLTIEERDAISTGPWFASLSPALRHDILRSSCVKRIRDGTLIAARGSAPQEWIACARGAVRISCVAKSGKLSTLAYAEPGTWFGVADIFDGTDRVYDAHAHGSTTILCVAREDLHKILDAHVELYGAMLRLQAWRIRQLLGLVEEISTHPLRARLASQLLRLVRSFGTPELTLNDEIRIGLQLAQEELAQLLGASRQRVNRELKTMEREGRIRIGPGGLVICDQQALLQIAQTGGGGGGGGGGKEEE